MKYLVRAVKYFFYFAFVTSAIVLALVLIGAVEGNIEAIFEGGYTALWKMAAFFAAVAAVYPSLAFIRKTLTGTAPLESLKNEIIGFMRERGYEMEAEQEGCISFRTRGLAMKLSRMYEDRITIRQVQDGIQIDGLRKDVIRLAAGMERFITPAQEQ